MHLRSNLMSADNAQVVTAEASDSQAQLRLKAEENAGLRGRVGELQAALAASQQSCRELVMSTQEAEQLLTGLNGKAATALGRLAHCSSELEAAVQQRDDALAELRQARQQLSQSTAELEAVKGQSQSMEQAEVARAKEAMAVAECQLAVATAELDMLRQSHSSEIKALLRAREALAACERQLADATAELANTKRSLRQEQAEAAQARETLAASQKQLAEHRMELLAAKRELSAARKAAHATECSRAAAEAESARAREVLAVTEKQAAVLRTHLDTAQAQVSAAREAAQVAEQAGGSAEAHPLERTAELEVATAALSQANQSAEAAQKAQASHERCVAEPSNQLEQTRSELRRAQARAVDSSRPLAGAPDTNRAECKGGMSEAACSGLRVELQAADPQPGVATEQAPGQDESNVSSSLPPTAPADDPGPGSASQCLVRTPVRRGEPSDAQSVQPASTVAQRSSPFGQTGSPGLQARVSDGGLDAAVFRRPAAEPLETLQQQQQSQGRSSVGSARWVEDYSRQLEELLEEAESLSACTARGTEPAAQTPWRAAQAAAAHQQRQRAHREGQGGTPGTAYRCCHMQFNLRALGLTHSTNLKWDYIHRACKYCNHAWLLPRCRQVLCDAAGTLACNLRLHPQNLPHPPLLSLLSGGCMRGMPCQQRGPREAQQPGVTSLEQAQQTCCQTEPAATGLPGHVCREHSLECLPLICFRGIPPC